MLGQVFSTIVNALAIIFIARLLGSINYGQVTIAYIPISTASLFLDLGVNGALVKYLAQYRSEERITEARALLKTGLIINTLAGLIFTIITYILSGYLATQVFHQPEINLLIQVSSINLLAQSLIYSARSIFIGYERMELVSLMVILQSVLKSILAPVLIYVGYGTLGAVTGQTASLVVAGIVGVLLIKVIYTKLRNGGGDNTNFVHTAKIILSYGVPLFFSLLLSGAIVQIYDFLMAFHVAPSDVGNYQAAINFRVLISFFIIPIATVLFPLFSKIPHDVNGNLASIYQNAVKYSALITVPLTSALILLSEPLVRIVYGSTYAQTPNYLHLVCVPFLLVGIGAQINDNLLNGQGKTRAFFMSNILTFTVGLPLSLYLIPRIGVTGLLITTILAQLTGLIYTTLWINRNLRFSINWGSSAKIYLSSAIPFIILSQILSMINLPNWTQLILGGILFLTLYITMILATRTLTIKDIENLRPILSSMGPFTPIFNIILDISEKIINRT